MNRLLLPLALIAAALVLRQMLPRFDPHYLEVLEDVPYVTLGMAGALSVYFHRARAFTAALAFLVVYVLIRSELQVALTLTAPLFLYTAISIAVPVAWLLLALLPERGLFNRYGLITAGMVPFIAALALLTWHTQTGPALQAAIQHWMPVHPVAHYWLSMPASLVFLCAAAAALYKVISRDSDFHAALIGMLVAVYLALSRFHLSWITALMFSVAGIILLISLLRGSYEMAYRDELTGLLGRRALNERLKGLGNQYVIAMVDVDHFKKFNDTWGHDAGDDVLKMVARQLAGVQGGGTAYRYGGEEFCIVFSGKMLEECRPYLEDVRMAVGRYRMQLRNVKQRPKTAEDALERRGRRTRPRGESTVSVTISIGVAAPGQKLNNVDAVLKAADKALYKAKQKGRNCLST